MRQLLFIVNILDGWKFLQKIKSEDVPFYENYRKNFELLYKDILNLCQHKNIDIESQYSNMDTFELKTALTLLPVMSDDETSIKQLIDNIKYYDSLLTKPECKKNLIKFVLKSRLSQQAKLRLQDDYTTVDNYTLYFLNSPIGQASPSLGDHHS